MFASENTLPGPGLRVVASHWKRNGATDLRDVGTSRKDPTGLAGRELDGFEV